MTHILGIDASLTSTGVSDGTDHFRIKTETGTPLLERTDTIASALEKKLFSMVRGVRAQQQFIFAVEGPSFGSHGHLYEVGYLMCRIELLARQNGVTVHIVPPHSLKKFVSGKGSTAKGEMQLKVFKKWGVEFQDDPGLDKLFAFCLFKYAEAMVAGEIIHAAPKPRGQGANARQTVRKIAKAKAAVAA